MISLVFKRTWDHKVDFPKTHFFIIVEENLISASTLCGPPTPPFTDPLIHCSPPPKPPPPSPPPNQASVVGELQAFRASMCFCEAPNSTLSLKLSKVPWLRIREWRHIAIASYWCATTQHDPNSRQCGILLDRSMHTLCQIPGCEARVIY